MACNVYEKVREIKVIINIFLIIFCILIIDF